jgi:hypothetical protein
MALQPYLEIAGNNLDNYADVSSISCTHGRATITEQPTPSTFNCTFYLLQTEYLNPIDIGSKINWRINNPTSGLGNTDVFVGFVTDVTVSLQWGGGNGFFQYSVTGAGRLVNLNKQTVGLSGYAKQYDGNRIVSILSDCNESTTYITAPGAYEIAAYASTNGATNALTLAQEAANSAMGCLFEYAIDDGKIRYQSYLDRPGNSEISLTTSHILANSYTIGITANTVCNQAGLTYGTAGGLSIVYDDTTSQTTYGVLSGQRSTTLHNKTDADTQAQTILASRKAPAYELKSVTINLATVDDTLRNELCGMFVGTRIKIDDLPTPELNSFTGFVEGYTWQSARGNESVTITLSNYGTLYPYTLWNDLNGTDTWNTVLTSLTTWEMVI